VRLLRTVFVLILLAAIAAAAGWYVVERPFGPAGETFVDIAPGTSTAGIAQQLKQAGIIRSALAFEAMKAWRGSHRGASLKAGEYRFDHPAPLAEVYARLARGDVYTITVVVPEGFNIFDIAQAVQAAGLAPREEFLQTEMQHTELIRQWSPAASSLEGFLFPDTYRFSRHDKPVDMLATMVRRFSQMATRLGLQPAGSGPGAIPSAGSTQPQTAQQIVTLASLIEREVRVPGERALVAGVFENRLQQGMPLQTDPSVVYASLLAGTWTGVIHQSELHAPSAYNTYGHAGLPPGPICNPGVASLQAAMHPVATDYLYFVADANGQTRFARSLAEHNANVALYRAAAGEAPAPAPAAALQPAKPYRSQARTHLRKGHR
jgi:UPF0755 protein